MAVIVVSKGRPAILRETLLSILQQTLVPSQIIVAVPTELDLPEPTGLSSIEFYTGRSGLCRQRNFGLEKVAPDTTYVAFFDDDFELKSDYLEKGVAFLDGCPSIVAFSGRILRDGDITREEARQVIANYQPKERYDGAFVSHINIYSILYGCCMMIRHSLLKYEKFDENLPLYSYGEDYDISIRLKRYGGLGRFQHCLGVHLQHPSGRVNEVQRGYSMVANNWYFLQKGVVHRSPGMAQIRFWAVIVVKPLAIAFVQLLKRDESIDWSARAKGFLFAVADIAQGRCSPDRMLNFSKPS